MEEKKPYLAAILIQFLTAGMFILSKAAFDDGMNTFVFIFYRQFAGTLLLVPLAMTFEGKSAFLISFRTFCKTFLLSLVGITVGLDVYGMALVYTSTTLVAAVTNCLPVITFALAIFLRMEKVNLRTITGLAKVGGLMLCLAGVVTLAFYKGPTLKPLWHFHHHCHYDHGTSSEKWILGCFLMFISTLCWALWIVFQCFCSTAQSFVVAIAMERDPSQWKLGWNIRLYAIAYSTLMITGTGYYVQAWLIEKKGPVFLAMWTPLALVITLFFSVFLLGEVIRLGSILGGILLIGSLYSVLWGKSKEKRLNSENDFVNTNCKPAEQPV
ncbi:WAT1-related protein At5g64700-like isoform X2 [Impatiens glandulifera]|uniref:WAT1-related protein At5g64700-like isoform X2 n=1 Tax=Impatiens glandulifera TaxID=253017 RepID=UPI001FB13050|nr:WAT1-related protein At5g64700-like isoform X2 [Impatiens glandulifera]